MLKRIGSIRQDFPQSQASDLSVRLKREIDDARARAKESLLKELPASTSTLHVFLEMTPYMQQLELICEHLVQELPARLEAAGVQRISFSILASASSSTDENAGMLPTIAPFDVHDSQSWSTACAWLSNLKSHAPAGGSRDGKSSPGYNFAQALRWSTTSEASDRSSRPCILLVACSKPLDLDACNGMARRSNVPLQTVGVFGLSPEDPEAGLQELTDAAANGSSFWLFFGPLYWSQFIAVREQQLQSLDESEIERAQRIETADGSDNEVVSAKVFEMRLIERVMRECYSEEQQCEEELTCATRVFERTLIEREDLLAVLRDGAVNAKK